MLRRAPNGAAAIRHIRRSGRRGSQTSTVRRATEVPLSREFVYEPQRSGPEPIALSELQSLFELEAESSRCIAQDAEGPGWQAIFESGGARLEQWLPSPEDPNELQICIFRTSLALPGVPPSVAFEQLYEVPKRRAWDPYLQRLQEVSSVPPRVGEGGVQSDLLHVRVDPLLSFLPACELLLWRAYLIQETAVQQPGCSAPRAILVRNADIECQELTDEAAGDWISPIRVRRMVHGCVVRALDPSNDQAGTRIYGYLQMKVNSALQYVAPSLAAEIALGSRDSYKSACLAAMASFGSTLPTKMSLAESDADLSPFAACDSWSHETSAMDSDSDVSVASEFLGGAPSSALASQRERRRATRKSLQHRRCSAISQHRPSLRAVQLHRWSAPAAVDLSSEAVPSVDLCAAAAEQPPADSPSVSESRGDGRRAARRARSHASQQQSMLAMAGRLSEVMYIRGSMLEPLLEDGEGTSTENASNTADVTLAAEADEPGQARQVVSAALQNASACEPTETRAELTGLHLEIRADHLLEEITVESPSLTTCWSSSVESSAETPSQLRRSRFSLPRPSRRSCEARRSLGQTTPEHTARSSAPPFQPSSEMQVPILSTLATSTPASSSAASSPRSEWFDGAASQTVVDAQLRKTLSKIAKIGKEEYTQQTAIADCSFKLDAVHPGVSDSISEKALKVVEILEERSQDRHRVEPEPGPEPGPEACCPGTPSNELSCSRSRTASADAAAVSQQKAAAFAEALFCCADKELVATVDVLRRDKKEKNKRTGDGRKKSKHHDEDRRRKGTHKEVMWV